jgi:hypothetical protein
MTLYLWSYSRVISGRTQEESRVRIRLPPPASLVRTRFFANLWRSSHAAAVLLITLRTPRLLAVRPRYFTYSRTTPRLPCTAASDSASASAYEFCGIARCPVRGGCRSEVRRVCAETSIQQPLWIEHAGLRMADFAAEPPFGRERPLRRQRRRSSQAGRRHGEQGGR